jgi:hypothetical protein
MKQSYNDNLVAFDSSEDNEYFFMRDHEVRCDFIMKLIKDTKKIMIKSLIGY